MDGRRADSSHVTVTDTMRRVRQRQRQKTTNKQCRIENENAAPCDKEFVGQKVNSNVIITVNADV